ncbi:MAG: DUF1232 domain-containing protein [Chryseolinea sp.]
MKNRFFEIAMQQAAKLAGNKSRILQLLTQLGSKIGSINWNVGQRDQIQSKLFTLGRFVTAYAQGRYRGVPGKTILLLLAAVIYFINPLDLIPDLIPLAGFTDDFAILIWVYNSMGSEIDKFIAWEESQITQI